MVKAKPRIFIHLDVLFGLQMQKHTFGQQPTQLMKARVTQQNAANENIKLYYITSRGDVPSGLDIQHILTPEHASSYDIF